MQMNLIKKIANKKLFAKTKQLIMGHRTNLCLHYKTKNTNEKEKTKWQIIIKTLNFIGYN